MRRILMLALVGACGAPPPEVAHPEPSAPARPSDWWIEKNPAPARARGQDWFERMPALKRNQAVEATTLVPGIEVVAVPVGATGWRLAITNSHPNVASVTWDESTFVASSGESWGRLIRGETKRMDVANVQPASPVAPGATLAQIVLCEKTTTAEEVEELLAKRRDVHKSDVDRAQRLRSERNALIVGGTLHITVQLADGKKTWSGRVIKTASGFCYKEHCAPTLEECNEIRARIIGSDGVAPSCAKDE